MLKWFASRRDKEAHRQDMELVSQLDQLIEKESAKTPEIARIARRLEEAWARNGFLEGLEMGFERHRTAQQP